MTKEELKQGYQPKSCNLKNIVPPSVSTNVKPKKDGYTWEDLDKAWWEGFDNAKNKMEKRIAELETNYHDLFVQFNQKIAEIEDLKAQIEKLIDFVLSKIECCDVCPITDTCINSEGTCPYAGILAKGEEEVTREWLMQFISKEIKEK